MDTDTMKERVNELEAVIESVNWTLDKIRHSAKHGLDISSPFMQKIINDLLEERDYAERELSYYK